MLKSKIESRFRAYVKENISPKQEDISFVSIVYNSFIDVLGRNNCRQIGSFPRYTAIRPLHDLDIIFKISDGNFDRQNPENFLRTLVKDMEDNYVNPSSYSITINIQTHSVAFLFMNGEDEVFAVDIVPAMIRGKNEFGDDTFFVPKIVQFRSHSKRQEYYDELRASKKQMQWIKTDPLGYITVASEINKKNDDFRKSVKLVKAWKNRCKEINEDFKLKSFHLEQIITEQLKKQKHQSIYDSLFECLTSLKQNIQVPKIKDRADSNKYIDKYVQDLTGEELRIITQAIDAVLIAFENFEGNVIDIINAGYYKRSIKEKFLFDHKIPVLTDSDLNFEIDGFIKNVPGFREYSAKLSRFNGKVSKKNSIRFEILKNDTDNDSRKWKIRNDNCSDDPRGDLGYEDEPVRIESTLYDGKHFAECYAIKNGECIARSKVDVII